MDPRSRLVRLLVLGALTIVVILILAGLLISSGKPLSPVPPDSPIKIIYMTPTPGITAKHTLPSPTKEVIR